MPTTEWMDNVNVALERGRRENKPVLLDFSAAPM